MVLEFLETLRAAGVGVVWIDICAQVRVFQIFAVHFVEVDSFSSTDEAECAVKFVVIGCGFCKDVVLCHVVRYFVHSSFGE